MNSSALSKVLEYLRQGAPPYGMSSRFTVGDCDEVKALECLICGQGPHLVETYEGCGKSHLLDHIREKALEQAYVVSVVKLDSEQEVGFYLFDQIVGAVFRGLELPGMPGKRGVQPFMDALCRVIEDSRFTSTSDDFWPRLTNEWTWDVDKQGLLESPALYIGLRAWCVGSDDKRLLVEDWLGHPWRYTKDRMTLVCSLIKGLRPFVLDPRPPSELYSNKSRLFHFREPDYVQSWAVLRDIGKLATAAGFNGVVLIFDDLDDIFDKLDNVKFQKLALANLFRFLELEQFGGKSFFAVDPSFEEQLRHTFARKRHGDYDLSKFHDIPRFRVSALREEDLLGLAGKLVDAHFKAYNWSDSSNGVYHEVESIVRDIERSVTEHRNRRVVRAVVEYLDGQIEAHQ